MDYFFLDFTRQRFVNEWMVKLVQTGLCKPFAEDPLNTSSSAGYRRKDRAISFLCKGWLGVSFGDGSSVEQQQHLYCVLDAAPCMTLFDSPTLEKDRSCTRLYLLGATVAEEPALKRFRLHCVPRPLVQGRLDIDYVFFTPPATSYALWKAAFSDMQAQSHEHQTEPSLHATSPSLPLLQGPGDEHGFARETTNWLHGICHRFLQNMRVSAGFTSMLRAKMTKKLQEKIEARELESTIEGLEVIDLHIPPTVPRVLFAQLLRNDGGIACDFLVDWHVEDDPLTFKVALTVLVNFPSPRWKEFHLSMMISVKRLFGKMHMECEPFPATRFSLSFFHMPDIELSVVSGFDALPASISSRLENYLVAKMKLALFQVCVCFFFFNFLVFFFLRSLPDCPQKLVMPNRKYFSIAGDSASKSEKQQQQPPPIIPERRVFSVKELPPVPDTIRPSNSPSSRPSTPTRLSHRIASNSLNNDNNKLDE